MTRPSRISPWLCAAALSIGSLAAPALAAPFATTYTGQVSSSQFPEITVGQSYTVTFVFDNGGSTANAQTWTAAHLICTIWRMNNARNVVYAQNLVATPPSLVTGSVVSNASGGLTGMFSEVTQGTLGISSGYTITGMVLPTPVTWFANSGNGVFYGDNPNFVFRDAAGGVQMAPANWTSPQPFPGNCSVISITPDNVATGTVGVAYNQALSATPVVAPLTWSATGLPAGLFIDPATGVILGTPTAPTATPASVVVTVTDSSTPTALTASQSLSLFVNPAPLAITTAGAPPATVGQAYSQAMASTGGLAPLLWSATGLPAGLAIDPATGVISGTPTAPTATPASVVVTVTDSSTPTALTASQNLSLFVNPAPLAITTAGASAATVGLAYSQAMASTGGLAPLTWSATGLPAGLAIDPATGVITGTPTAPTASPASVVITVTDSSTPTALTASQTLSLVVAAAPVVVAPTPVPTLGQWALVVLSLMAAALGMGTLRRQAGHGRTGF